MAPRPALPTQATLVAPSWMAGGRPKEHLAAAALRPREIAGALDRWRVQTEESYHRRRPDLISVEHLAGPTVRDPRLERLLDAQRSALYDDGEGWGKHHAALKARQERAVRSHELIDAVNAWRAMTSCAPAEQLPGIATLVRDSLLAMTVTERPAEPVMTDAGVHLVRQASALVFRTKLCLLLLQAEHDPRLQAADLAAVSAALEAGDTPFAASADLFSGVLLGDAYLAPLLGALSPIIWAFCAPRSLGVVVYSLGQPLAGTTGDAAELLQTLPNQSSAHTIPVPTLPEPAGVSALDWWTRRTNDLFGAVTDPALATDTNGVYVASKQAHVLLSIEQLFRRVAAIQATHRDDHARRVLLFTVFDTLERLTGRKITDLASARYAHHTLDALSAEIPAEAATILLPAAQRAVAALDEVQRGFFLTRQLGKDNVDVPSKGGVRSLDLDRAAAEYLKVLRDATHGHGSNKGERVGITNALLAQHDGRIPHDLALLGYLYLLDLLQSTENLKYKIHRRGQV
jgi:hypothetical protein